MKGIILAGGKGTRLQPLTRVVNKHLLPVYDEVMIRYPLDQMYEAGFPEVGLVANAEDISTFQELLEGDPVVYIVQQETGRGIADAIGSAESYAKGETLCVRLGDNIFLDQPLSPEVLTLPKQDQAVIFVKEVEHPELNGVVEFDDSGKVIGIEEKPQDPKTNFIQTGVYLYPPDVFDKIKLLRPSFRDEIEVADLNRMYAEEDRLHAVTYEGEWVDAGTSFDDLINAGLKIKERR